MNLRRILIFIFLIVFAIAILSIYGEQSQSETDEQLISFEPLKLSSAGDQAYVSYSSNGSSSITLITLTQEPIEKIYVLDKSSGIGLSSLADFIHEIESLEEYGLIVKPVSSISSIPDDSLIIVAQGAMPESILPLLEENLTILYIGKTDALISTGVIHQDWYSPLEEYQKEKIILYNTTLDDLYAQEEIKDITNIVLFNSWALESNKTYNFYGGKGTATIPLEEATYLRVIYPTTEGYRIADSKELNKPEQIISLEHAFPSEKRSLYLTIEESKGIPELVVYKDNSKLYDEKLGTVGQDVFYKSLSFEEPGEYVLRVNDYSGEIASGILHVKNLKIEYIGSDTLYYNFYVTLDGVPVDGEEAVVHLQHSNQTMSLYISNGNLAIPAKLQKGANTFVIMVYDQESQIQVEYTYQGVLDVYIQYGPWILAIILIVYIAVMFTRKHPYKIRFDSVISPSSGEVKISLRKIQKIIPRSILEFGSNNCINAREFSLALRKYITDGYDVMDGNAEAILKKLERKECLESYKSFYRLKGKGDVKKTVMDRLIREKLIEQGIAFKYKDGVFQTKEQNVVFGKQPVGRGKSIVVFESKNAVLNYMESLPQKIKAKIALKIRNSSLLLLSIDELAEYL